MNICNCSTALGRQEAEMGESQGGCLSSHLTLCGEETQQGETLLQSKLEGKNSTLKVLWSSHWDTHSHMPMYTQIVITTKNDDSGAEWDRQARNACGSTRESKNQIWICTRSPKYMLWLLVWCFCGTPNSGSGVSLANLLALGTLPPIGLSCLAYHNRRAFALSCCVSFCSVWLWSLGSLLFSEDQTGVEWGGSGGKERWTILGVEEEKGGQTGWDVLHERKIYFHWERVGISGLFA